METGGVVVIRNMNTTALSVVQNATVSPFTNYTATVVAYTSAGSGDSVMQVVLSPEAGTVTIWISWHFLPWELEGITSLCCLLIGQYPHHMTLCPSVPRVKWCYEIHLYRAQGDKTI